MTKIRKKRMTVRIYAIVIDDKNRVLLSNELTGNRHITKFPGGGMKLGESTRQTLEREFMEEMGQTCCVKEHVYTADIVQGAFSHSGIQLLSVYYTAEFLEKPKFKIYEADEKMQDINPGDNNFWWCPIETISENIFTLPTDKLIAERLRNNEILT